MNPASKSKMETSYHIILPCTREQQSDPVMKLENFVTQLPEDVFELQDEWEIALTEITFPKIWISLPCDQKIDILKFSKNDYNLIRFINFPEWKIEKGDYTLEELIEKTNEILGKIYDKDEDNELFLRNHNDKKVTMQPKLEIDPLNSKNLRLKYGCLYHNERFFVRFSEILGNIFGFGYHQTNHLAHKTFKNYKELFELNPDHILKKWENQEYFENAIREFNIDRNLEFLYLTCDAIKDSYFGDIRTNLLRVVNIPRDSKFGDQITIIYENPYYFPIKNNIFNKIEIANYQNLPEKNTGKLVPFSYGTLHVHLHLKKCNNNVNISLEPEPNLKSTPKFPDTEKENDNPYEEKVIKEEPHPFANWSE